MPDDLQTKCYLYWIHLPEQTDIFTQGYVGITTNEVEFRFKQHKFAAKKGKQIIHKALRKYEDILVIETLVIGTLGYCADLEKKLRPERYIGWNSACGGLFEGVLGRKDSITNDDLRKKISDGVKKAYQDNPDIVERQSAAKRKPWSATRREQMKGAHKDKPSWKNSKANKEYWLMADIFYDFIQENPEKGYVLMAQHFDVISSKVQAIFKRIKNGWNPNECPVWQEFFKQNQNTI